MIIKNLKLKQFRNYDDLNVTFEPNINFILGKNATGKTNIVEAIHYMSLTRSFRSDDDSDLIKNNSSFATIEGTFLLGDVTKNIKIVISPKGKKILCNGYEIKKISELSKLINVIVFKPIDVLMFDDTPSVRRKFLDINISKMDYTYLKSMSEFDKLLKERNESLKQEHCDKNLLEVLTDQLIASQKQIVLKRNAFVEQLNIVVNKVLKAIKGENDTLRINYYPFVKIDENYLKEAKKAYDDNLENDLKHKSTSIGVHRENFKVLLNGKDISSYGSQGEKRLAALSLVLSPYFLISDKDKRPIVILDDVLSELDKVHQNKLVQFVSKMEQVFITATHYDDQNVNAFYVKDRKITRR